MGLATIDPHSHRVQTKLYKIAKFGVNRPNSKQDAAILKNNYKEMCMPIRTRTERPDGHSHFFVNFEFGGGARASFPNSGW